ncbi:MAG TPA: DEAD/DEAH box helicase [Methanomicrobia archaeon]|nr:DEAD/DEAH box helicase [Methanomicrobia archaeon]
MNAFSLLSAEIQAVVGETFTAPTEPQALSIPRILAGEDVLLIAPTGSGKTEAAVLPVLHQLIAYKKQNNARKGFLALYVTPLRALNRDMLLRLERLGAQLELRIDVRHGDTSMYARRRQALEPPDILITTPETIQAMIPGARLREHLKSVRHVILDEVHELANSKRGAQLTIALERIAELAGGFQRICLSATVGNPEQVAKYFAGQRRTMQVVNTVSTKALQIAVLSPQRAPQDMRAAQSAGVEPDVLAHVRALREIVNAEGNESTLIFVNTRRAAEMLGSIMNRFEPGLIGVHHGSLSKEMRIEAEDRLKSGAIKGLICTSSMELGIDIGTIDMVVQYASPREVTRLVQRVGRASHSFQTTSSGKIIALSPDDVAEAVVITERAKGGKIEDIKLKEGSMDVLANQICGLLLDTSVISLEKLRAVLIRAYPFRDLTREALLRVIAQLEAEGLVKYEAEKLWRSKGTRAYYYENLSMIPDERKIEVYDIVSGKLICMLDERFALNFADPGALFVAKGDTWRIVDTELDAEDGLAKLRVEPGVKRKGEIPNWEGEEIPVPFVIAQDVGQLRARIAAARARGVSTADLNNELEQEYGVSAGCFESLIALLSQQLEQDYPVPTAQTLVIEIASDHQEVVFNTCWGHQVNETFGRLLITLLGARLGMDIAMEIDPYRIKVRSGRAVSRDAVQQTLAAIEPQYVQALLEKTIRNSFLFRWELMNVAKRFGALRKQFDRKRISADKLIALFADTPIYTETVRELFADKLDVERTVEVVKKIKSGEIRVLFSAHGVSPVGAAGYTSWRDMLASERDEQLIIEALRNRIMNDRVLLFCVHCKRWEARRHVKTVIDQGQAGLVCPVCSSRLIAALKPWEDEEIRLVKQAAAHNTGARAERARVKRVYRNANLVLSHGPRAVVALAARGVGPEIASRIIRRVNPAVPATETEAEEHRFYRQILDEERKYARTKRFWE